MDMFLVALAVVVALIVVCAIVGARRGTDQVTTLQDSAAERERIRGGGTGFKA
jgi:hypothetical protein